MFTYGISICREHFFFRFGNSLLHLSTDSGGKKKKEKKHDSKEMCALHRNTETTASLCSGKSQGILEGVKEEWVNCVSRVLNHPHVPTCIIHVGRFRYICLPMEF